MGAGCGPNVSDLYDNESPRLVAYGSFLSARERLSRFYVHASVLRAYERQERSSNEFTCSFKKNFLVLVHTHDTVHTYVLYQHDTHLLT